jgi:hypothetical protein
MRREQARSAKARCCAPADAQQNTMLRAAMAARCRASTLRVARRECTFFATPLFG